MKTLLNTILLLVLTLSTVSGLAAEELALGGSASYSLAGHLETYADPGGSLSFADILEKQKQQKFKQIPGFVNAGYTDDTLWVRFSVLRTSPFPEEPILRLWPPYLDNVDVYLQTGDESLNPDGYRKFSTGDHVPVAARPVVDADLAIPLHLPENRPVSVYLKIRTSSSLNLSGSIHTEPDYITTGSFTVARNGGYESIAIVVSLISLIMFIRLRDRLYLFFSLYIFALAVNDFAISGILTLFLPDLAHLLSDYLVGVGAAVALLFFALFGMRLFENEIGRWSRRFFHLLIVVAAATALSVPLGLYNRLAPLLFLSSLASIILLTWLSFRGVQQKSEGAFVYLTAFGISNIGYAVQFLRVLGLLPVAWWNMSSIQVASVCNMVLITLAMTERVHRAENRALQAALEAEQKAVEIAMEMTAELREKQRSLEDALAAEREAIESQIRFVDIISHEYRTPLAIIRTNLDIMEMKACGEKCGLADNMDKIKRSLFRLVEILEVSLGKERLDRSRLQLKPVNLAEFIADVVHEGSDLWDTRDIDFDCPGNLQLPVEVDTSLLKTAVFNLLDNACKYSPENAAVTVSCRREGATAVIAVTDAGSGIPLKDLDFIFKKNFRGANSGNVRGMGMGLFLVSKITELHGGRIDVSRVENRTTISIILSLFEDNPPQSL